MSASIPELPALTGWATIAEAADLLGVHRDTIMNMVARGDLYAERIGPRLIRVDLDSIQPVPLGPAPSVERTVRRPLEVNERIAAGGVE